MKNIYAVDDSASIRLYMDKSLSKMGYRVELAEDGDAALEGLKEHSGTIDVFVIDVVMRRMDGITLIKHIRKIDRFKNTPVIVLTNLDDQSMIETAKAAGANCWISKPFEAEKVAEVIESLVQ
ncbi:MAG: response regulator [Spirochaetales bacterium]|nr:response regulator [Spirochaetales bacterium]